MNALLGNHEIRDRLADHHRHRPWDEQARSKRSFLRGPFACEARPVLEMLRGRLHVEDLGASIELLVRYRELHDEANYESLRRAACVAAWRLDLRQDTRRNGWLRFGPAAAAAELRMLAHLLDWTRSAIVDDALCLTELRAYARELRRTKFTRTAAESAGLTAA